jgi:hypothetical protein
VHVLAALTAVLTGATAAIAGKGGPHPIRAGRWYFHALTVVFASALALAAMRPCQDYHLALIGVVAFTAATVGYQHRRRRRSGDTPHIAGMGLSYIAMLTAFYVDNGPSTAVGPAADRRLVAAARCDRHAHHRPRNEAGRQPQGCPGSLRAGQLEPGGGAELVEQSEDAAFDFVADRTYGGDTETGWIVERPLLIPLAGKTGQASPHPMVITTSVARTISSVHGLGYSPAMSMPRSVIASIAAGLSWSPGSEPPDHATAAAPAWWLKNPSAIWVGRRCASTRTTRWVGRHLCNLTLPR